MLQLSDEKHFVQSTSHATPPLPRPRLDYELLAQAIRLKVASCLLGLKAAAAAAAGGPELRHLTGRNGGLHHARHGVISFWRQLYSMAHYEGGGQGMAEAGRTMKGQLTSLCVTPRHNRHYADFESVIENFIEKVSLFLSPSLYIYVYLFFIAGGQLRGQAKLSVLLFVSSLIGIFSRIYILVLCDAFSFM